MYFVMLFSWYLGVIWDFAFSLEILAEIQREGKIELSEQIGADMVDVRKIKVDDKLVETKKLVLNVAETSSSYKTTNANSQAKIFITKNISNKKI